MLRKILFAGATVACVAAMLTGCSKKNPAEPEDETPTAPSGATLVFAEGFGGDLSEWDNDYMVDMFHIYPRMRTTTDAAHTGTHALTTDSNNTALLFSLLPADRIESGIAGVQFYIMAKELGQANFTVEIGANAGSSGGVQPAFGIGFDPSDSSAPIMICIIPTTTAMAIRCSAPLSLTAGTNARLKQISLIQPLPIILMMYWSVRSLWTLRALWASTSCWYSGA
jgi:hypothetical protein